MTLREALQAVYDRHGQLTPRLVVEEARKAQDDAGKHLQGRLEWNNKVAGEAYRRQQAHELIRSVKVVYREATKTESEKSVRAFHAIRGETGHVYEPVEQVAQDPFLKRMLLADMEREWRTLKVRWEDFDEFSEMVRRDTEVKAA